MPRSAEHRSAQGHRDRRVSRGSWGRTRAASPRRQLAERRQIRILRSVNAQYV